jgi:hypothetical protein
MVAPSELLQQIVSLTEKLQQMMALIVFAPVNVGAQ